MSSVGTIIGECKGGSNVTDDVKAPNEIIANFDRLNTPIKLDFQGIEEPAIEINVDLQNKEYNELYFLNRFLIKKNSLI